MRSTSGVLSTSVRTAASTDGAAYVPVTERPAVTVSPAEATSCGELVEVSAHEVGAEQGRRVGTGDARRQLDERLERRLLVERAGHEHGDGAAVAHHARHLVQGETSIDEEHQRHLAQRHVEGAVGERQRGRVALPPVDVRPHASGDGEHRLVEIEADDRSAGADEVGSGAGDDPRPARDVEDRLPRRHAGDARRGSAPTGRRSSARRRTRTARQPRSGSGTTRWSCSDPAAT